MAPFDKEKSMSKKNAFDRETVPNKPITEKEKQWLEEDVDVEFYNLEEPGVMNTFPYGPTNNFKVYRLFHGGKYKLPRKVVQHIESRQTPIWKYKHDGMGRTTKFLESYKPRFQCRQVFA